MKLNNSTVSAKSVTVLPELAAIQPFSVNLVAGDCIAA